MIKLANTSFGIVIGEQNIVEKDRVTLTAPRMLIVETKGPETEFKIGEYPWKPSVIELPFNHVAFDVTEENIVKAYRQHVSGLVLPSSGNIQKLQ